MKKVIRSILICLLIFAAFNGNAQNDTSNIIMYDDTTQFNSIEDIIALPSLKGKVIYIDIWGTRCIPCIEEFPYLATLKNRYKDQPVAFVYLKAPYGWDDSKQWKELVNKHHLEGINISMSIKFYTDNFWKNYKDIYTEKRMFIIPTYLVINKKGKIINFDAPRPSDGEKLYKILDREL